MALCFSTGMVAMALSMQMCIALQVSLSLSWPSFVSEIPAPVDWKTGQKQSRNAQSLYFIFSTAAFVTSLLSLRPSCIEIVCSPCALGVLPKYSGIQTYANEANWHLLPWPVRGNLCLPLLSSDKQPALTRDSTVHYLRHHPCLVLLLTRP